MTTALKCQLCHDTKTITFVPQSVPTRIVCPVCYRGEKSEADTKDNESEPSSELRCERGTARQARADDAPLAPRERFISDFLYIAGDHQLSPKFASAQAGCVRIMSALAVILTQLDLPNKLQSSDVIRSACLDISYLALRTALALSDRDARESESADITDPRNHV